MLMLKSLNIQDFFKVLNTNKQIQSAFQNSHKLFSTGITRPINPQWGSDSIRFKEEGADASFRTFQMSVAQSRPVHNLLLFTAVLKVPYIKHKLLNVKTLERR